jgi:general secretion pathway protein G
MKTSIRKADPQGAGRAPHPEQARAALARRRRRQRGVTLIEMLVVVVIIALFVSLVGVNLFKRADEAKRTAAKAQIDSFMTAIGAYKLDTGSFPTTDQGLAVLRVKPEGSSQWAGPYLPKDIPLDPWNNKYLYKYPGEHGDEPDIISLGADGQEGGEGNNADIESWSNAK